VGEKNAERDKVEGKGRKCWFMAVLSARMSRRREKLGLVDVGECSGWRLRREFAVEFRWFDEIED
jgi:hypothetical protein